MEERDNTNTEKDELGTGWIVLSFCIPLAGAIMYFNHKERSPGKAKSACNAALIGFGIGILIRVAATVGG